MTIDVRRAPTAGGAHPNLATHDALGLATDAELTTHAGAADPHTVYVREADANWIDLTDLGATTLHSHAGGSGIELDPVFIDAGDPLGKSFFGYNILDGGTP